MAAPVAPDPPELPDLDAGELGDGDEIVLAEACVTGHPTPIAARRLRADESTLDQVTLAPGTLSELVLRDARLTDCDLSNVTARQSEVRRAELVNARLVGFAFGAAVLEDLRVSGGTLMLASLAQTSLRRAVFEDVNLREASFAQARLISVVFQDCDLRGADFRGATVIDCAIRGSSLEGVVGVESLRGLAMPWADLVGSAGALAAALGITAETE